MGARRVTVVAQRRFSRPGWSLGAGDGLLGADRVGAAECRCVAAADEAGAPADVVDVQVAAGGERFQCAGAVGVGAADHAVVRGGAGAVDHGAAAGAGQCGVDAGEGAGRDAAGGVEKDTAFRLHGKWLVVTVNVMPSGPMQLLNASDVIEPMPVPDSPLPLLSVAAPFEDAQDSETPLRVSVRVVLPAVAATGPPGLTVQVAATAGAALRPITAAIAAPMKRTLPVRLRIAMSPISLIDLPVTRWRAGCWSLIRPRLTLASHAGSLRAGASTYGCS